MQFVRIEGVTIAYDVITADPANPVLVLVNSLGTDARIWHLVVPKLAEDFTVVTYDKRGHGLSDLGNPPYRIEDHVADLAGLLDHLEFSDAIICGLSVGGLVAQGLYAQRPDLVRALVLADTAHKIGTVEMWDKRIAAIEDAGIAAIVDDIMARWFTAPFRSPENAAYGAYCNMLLRQPVSGYTGCGFHQGGAGHCRPYSVHRRRAGWIDAAGSGAVACQPDPGRPVRGHRGGGAHSLRRSACRFRCRRAQLHRQRRQGLK